MVLLRLRPYRQTIVARRVSQKLAKRLFGPFPVLRRTGAIAYELDLLAASQIHPVIHVSQLRPYFGSNPSEHFKPIPPPDPQPLIRNNHEDLPSLELTDSENTNSTTMDAREKEVFVGESDLLRKGDEELLRESADPGKSPKEGNENEKKCHFPPLDYVVSTRSQVHAPRDSRHAHDTQSQPPIMTGSPHTPSSPFNFSEIRASTSDPFPSPTCTAENLPHHHQNLEDKVLFKVWSNDSPGQPKPKRITQVPKKLEDYVLIMDGATK